MSVLPGEAAVRVLGLGNVLMGDDALGPWVVHHLASRWELPAGVEAVDVGTPGLDLTPYLAGARTVIVVDTVKSGGAPGEVRLYRKAELLAHPPQPRVSPHDPGLVECLLALDFAGIGPPEVLLVGVIPDRVGKGTGLSAALAAAVPRAAGAVVEELTRLGLAPAARPAPSDAPPWWEVP